MQTIINTQQFYPNDCLTPSLKVFIQYPSIPNLSYNFILQLIIWKQTLLPKITYTKIYQNKFYIPKKQLIVNQLDQGKMYKVQIKWTQGNNQKGNKNVFVSMTKRQRQQPNSSIQQDNYHQYQQYDHDQLVKNNIRNYFQQYHQSNASNISHLQPRRGSNSIQTYEQLNQSVNISEDIYLGPNTSPLCNSQKLVKVIGQSDSYINKKNIQKYILQARKSNSIKDYLCTKDMQCFGNKNKVYKNQQQRRKFIQKTLLITKSMNMFNQIYQFDKQHQINNETNLTTKSKIANRQNKGMEFFKNDWFMGPLYSYDINQHQINKKK